MKFTKIIITVLLIAPVGGVVFYYNRPAPLAVIVAQVNRGKIESTVVNSRAGTVKACRRSRLSPAIGGQIATWPVAEGMAVKKGDLLMSLWNDDLRAQVQLTESEYEAVKSTIEATCLQAGLMSLVTFSPT